MLEILDEQMENFDIPEEPENFEIYVDNCVVHPVFSKKSDELRVHYDFSLCNTKIRTLALSMYYDASRIEITLKNEIEIKENI